MRLETILAQAGLCSDERTGAISTPIYQSATFRHPAFGHSTGYDYSRTTNPTREVLEKVMAELESGSCAFAFSSGMAAIAATCLLFPTGSHLLLCDDLYGGTYRLFQTILCRYGFTFSSVDMADLDRVEGEIRDNTRALFVETPTNPMMKVNDLAALAALARKHGLKLIADNTFMTPYLQRPITHGADLVVHSGSKYLGGHNDLISGFVVAADPAIGEALKLIQNGAGSVLGPFDSWLTLRGLKTLALRLDRSQESARRLVEWLRRHPAVREVFYPGLAQARDLEIHARQAHGTGAMVSFRVASAELAQAIIGRVRLISFAESLGGVESLITYPFVQTHADIPASIRERLGITDTLLRLSLGIEAAEDLITDLAQAMGG